MGARENALCGFPSSGGRRSSVHGCGSVHAVVELREDVRELHHLTGHYLVARSLLVRSDRYFEDRFLQKAIAGQRRMRVLREEDREVTRWNRKPGGGGILVELNVLLLVKRPNRSVTRFDWLPADFFVAGDCHLNVDVTAMRFERSSSAAPTLFVINRKRNSRSIDFVAVGCELSQIARKNEIRGDPKSRVKVKISFQLRQSV